MANEALATPQKRGVARARRNYDRENRIHEEIIVDAYGPEEQAMSWYYYLEEKAPVPVPCTVRCFRADISAAQRGYGRNPKDGA